jgi:hypothetical protein
MKMSRLLNVNRSALLALVLTVIVSLLIGLNGCSAMKVTHEPSSNVKAMGDVPGVPFFPKKARCRQEIVWFEPIYTLTLAALVPDKDGALQSQPRGAVVLSRSKFMNSIVTDYVKLLNNPQTDVGTLSREWAKVVALSDASVLSRDFATISASDRILAGRSAGPVVYVDYNDQYYVNAKIPLSGSAQLDAKVAEDGSLSEASAQVENKTLDTILSALPISSVITGGLGLAGKGPQPAEKSETYQLTVSVSGYVHTLAKLVEFPQNSKACPAATDISIDSADEYKREEMNASNDSGKTGKSDDSKASSKKDNSAATNNGKKPGSSD